MSKGLEALERLHEFAWSNEEYRNDMDNTDYQIIEKELKDYNEIREIAKHYNFEDLGSEVCKIDTDRKWHLKFDAGIVAIQEDYRKARALEIIKNKGVNVPQMIKEFRAETNYEKYKELWEIDMRNFVIPQNCMPTYSKRLLVQEEYCFLKKVLL